MYKLIEYNDITLYNTQITPYTYRYCYFFFCFKCLSFPFLSRQYGYRRGLLPLMWINHILFSTFCRLRWSTCLWIWHITIYCVWMTRVNCWLKSSTPIVLHHMQTVIQPWCFSLELDTTDTWPLVGRATICHFGLE